MLILKNGTKNTSLVGYCAKMSSKDGYFELAGVGDVPIGIIKNAVPTNADCEIITDGEALVYLHKKVRVGGYVRHHGEGDGAVKGSCVPVNGNVGPMVIGKALETGRGLVRVAMNMHDTSEFSLIDTQWDDLRVPAQNTKINPTKSEPAFEQIALSGLYAYFFDSGNASDESVHFSAQLPHGYKEGTDLRFHVHWMPSTTNTGNVVWELDYIKAPINSTFPTTATTLEVTDAADGTAYKHQISELGTIDGSDLKISSMLICRLTRLGTDVADTFTGDAIFTECDFHIQLNSQGSRAEYVK